MMATKLDSTAGGCDNVTIIDESSALVKHIVENNENFKNGYKAL